MQTEPLTGQEFAALLSHPEHLEAMGSAVRTFCWLWARIEKEARWSGQVEALNLAAMARSMGVSQRSVSRDLARLRDGDYLDSDFEGRGFSGWIQIWDPAAEQNQADKSGEAGAESGQPGQICR